MMKVGEISVSSFSIKVGARASPLSRAQVEEVLQLLHTHHPQIYFEKVWKQTTGDQDLKTSLRDLGKTDFFTKEIDEMLLEGKCRIAIHSAKDLPEPLPIGIQIVAITKGLDPCDSLVLRQEETLTNLPPKAIIATSSERREVAVKQLRSDLCFVDLRGTIETRLEKLTKREADGIVIAEAALIRLNLTHLNRIPLPGPTAPFQGQLAVLARDNDMEMQSLFSCIDYRKSYETE